jgi:hypothetical protein
MLITVIFINGKYGLVDDAELDNLIQKRKVKKFLRSAGWCTIGVDQIRTEPCHDYEGAERRSIKRNTVNVR